MATEEAEAQAVVRSYTSADLAACRALWIELTEWHRDLYKTLEIGGFDPGLLFDAHLERVGEGNLWVGEVSGQVVGLTGLIPDDVEPELEPLVVSESHRGQGLGKQLVEVVIQEAQARGARFLRVRPTARNHIALRVFHRLGFDVVGHVELLMDFRTPDRQRWEKRPRIADRNFRA